MTAAILVLFWATQVAQNYFFKYGSMTPSRWLPCFAAGSLVGLGSIWLVMQLYQRMSPTAVLCLTGGGTFLLLNITMTLVFKSWPSPLQWLGIGAVTIGMATASYGSVKT